MAMVWRDKCDIYILIDMHSPLIIASVTRMEMI
jgi:hypothetical protein